MNSLLNDYKTKTPGLVWSAVLRLANLWHCVHVRELAFRELDKVSLAVLPPLERVIIGRDLKAPQDWMQRALEALADRSDFLTVKEGQLLGMVLVIRVTRLRDQRQYERFVVPGQANGQNQWDAAHPPYNPPITPDPEPDVRTAATLPI